MRVDLHCHSTCSDGTFPPDRVGELARQAAVEVFCLTDHDSCEGSATAAESFAGKVTGELGTHVLRGVELSCHEAGKTVHLLFYDVANDQRWAQVDELLARQRSARRHRVRTIAARLEQRGIRIDADAILAAKAGQSVGRPDIARALVDAGEVTSMGEAFDRYLHDGGLADVPITRVSIEQAMALAGEVGARVSLAHPHTLGGAAPRIVDRFRPHGLDGIEAFYGVYTKRQRRPWLELAARYKMVATGGSDFHGEGFDGATAMGVDVPPSHAGALRDWLELPA